MKGFLDRCRALHGFDPCLGAVKPHRGHPEVYNFEHPPFSHPLDALRYLLVSIGRECAKRTGDHGQYAPSLFSKFLGLRAV